MTGTSTTGTPPRAARLLRRRPTNLHTATDLFCGAGGSSLGLTRTGLYDVKVALNHNPQAIASHRTAVPDADHHCVDISQADPARYPATRLLWSSPECTTYSSAHQPAAARSRGDREADGERLRSRSTGFDLLRWLEAHRDDVAVAIAENVVQWRSWKLWPTLTDGLDRLGYAHQIVYHNAALTGQVATWRDRMYLVCWDKSLPAPDLTVTSAGTCPDCGPVQLTQQFTRDRRDDETAYGRYRQPSHYQMTCTCGQPGSPHVRTADAIHDPAAPAFPVHDRPNRRPLTDATLERLTAAVLAHGRPAPDDTHADDNTRTLVFLNWKPTGSAWAAHDRPLNTITGIDSHGWVTIPNPGPGRALTARQAGDLLARGTYRMLTVAELADAMGFGPDAALSGTDRQQRIQIGMAVAPPAAAWLGRQVAPTLAVA